MLTRRTQLLLDDDRYARVQRRAAATRRSVGAVIREAIDVALPPETMSKQQAAEHFRTAPLMDIGSPEEIQREINTMYDRLG